MPKRKHIFEDGTVIGKLTVIKYLPGSRGLYECKCECGKNKKYSGSELASGLIKSCGQTNCRGGNDRHRMTNSRTWRTWRALRKRCTDVTSDKYRLYGSRGITYDPRWADFKEFLKDMGERPAGMTLDRIDVNGNYCKENCRWATPKEQGNNTRFNVILEYNGERLNIMQWAEKLGMNWATINSRLKRGWSIERSLYEKVSLSRADHPLTKVP